MNIYFSCSITGGRKDQAAYQAIVSALKADGHEVPTAVLADRDILDLEAVTPRKRFTIVISPGWMPVTRWWQRSAHRPMVSGMRLLMHWTTANRLFAGIRLGNGYPKC